MYRFLQKALYCSNGRSSSDQTTSGSVRQLSRVQGTNIDLSWQRAPQSYLSDETELIATERPKVALTFEYFPTAGNNENAVGFVTDGFHSAFYKFNIEKNYYVYNVEESTDAVIANNAPKTVLGIGNVLLNGYNIAGEVGGLLRATCALEGLNFQSYTGTENQINPGVDPETAQNLSSYFTLPAPTDQVEEDSVNPANDVIALGAKDLVMRFPTGSAFATLLTGANSCLLQGFNLAFSVDRNSIRPLGYVYPSDRSVIPPINVVLTAEALLDKYQVAALRDLSCDAGHDIDIVVNQPCSTEPALEFMLRGLKLSQQGIVSDLGGFTTVSFNWAGVVNNLNTSGDNVFMRSHFGNYAYILESATTLTGVDIGGDLSFEEQLVFNRSMQERVFTTGSLNG